MNRPNRLLGGRRSAVARRGSRLRRLKAGDRVLVIRPGALGDTILSLPSLQAMRRQVGQEGRIELVGYPAFLRLATSPLHADSFHSIDRAHFAGLFSGEFTPMLREFLARFDIVVAWCRDDVGHLSRLLESLTIPHLQCQPFPDDGSKVHAADHLMRSLEPLGVVGPTPNPQMVLPRDGDIVTQKFLFEKSLRPNHFLAVHPGSGSPGKNWSTNKFIEIIDLATKCGLGILVLEGKADREPVRHLLQNAKARLPVAKDLDLMALALLLTQASAYVGNDSGITHLAAATKTRTWALFGPTDPAVWGPRGPRVQVLPFGTNPYELWNAIQKVSRL